MVGWEKKEGIDLLSEITALKGEKSEGFGPGVNLCSASSES